MDLGYKGSKYTWSNHRKKSRGLIMERLDRIFVNNDWLSLFPKAMVIHLPKTYFDHNRLLINLTSKNMNYNGKPSRLETIWYRHPEFINIVKQCWTSNDLVSAQKSFKDVVIKCKNKMFGYIFKKKKEF